MSNAQDATTLARLFREGRRYWASADGTAHWRTERACLGPICERLHGGHRLELSMAASLTDMCPIRHGLRWAPTVELAESPSTLVCPPDALALPDECLHLVVIHHLLEVVPNPHRLLQEAARVTADDGRLIIFGWAPLGAAGIGRLWPGRRHRLPWRGRWRTPAGLRDWLAFVDFQIERVDYCGFHLPGSLPSNATLETLGRRHNLPLGDSYIIRARRRSRLAHVQRPQLDLGSALGGNALGHASRVGRHTERIRDVV
ncbi:class I SAM-dependent methyltransferase [Billgrantia gudaonensis]|uniref:Methyltransferase domain-containing protein n=1 Tax=Billgrantia gudaonensis TaxID=376427 RepID=A0A1G8WQS8_9GAMM|nr:methyltransferase domain-containing protein [Halomonas gudaonensis]SDJ79975.1 Methyltransferase domain-containing protein [Halomonas gudaonensis]